MDPLKELDAGHAGHFLVAEDQIDVAMVEMTLRCLAGIRREDLELRFEQACQSGQDIRFVIHYQKGALVLAHCQAS
jgi:hypothetical protein